MRKEPYMRKSHLLVSAVVLAITFFSVGAKKASLPTKLPPPGVDIVEHRLLLGIDRITPGPSGKLPTECQEASAVGAKSERIEEIPFFGRMILERKSPAKIT